MKYDFLRDYHRRMEKLSASFLIDSQVATKTEWEKYGLRLNQIINLVYAVMCLIMENSLKEEECTYRDINAFISTLTFSHYHLDLDEQAVYELAQYIVKRVLRNEGEPFIFEADDYVTGTVRKYQFQLVKQDYSKSDPSKSSFRLTEEGFRMLLSSYEIDQKLQIEIESLIAEQSIIRKSYRQGLVAVINLDTLLSAQIQKIGALIERTKENVMFVSESEFEETCMGSLDALRDQHGKYQYLMEVLRKEKEKVQSLIESRLDREHMDALVSIGEIETGLRRIIDKSVTLLSRHSNFNDEYQSALERLAYIYSSHTLDIREAFLKPVEEDITRLDNIHLLFNALFLPHIPKRFNLDKIFEKQSVAVKEEAPDIIPVDRPDTAPADRENRDREQYRSILRTLLYCVRDQKAIDLQCIVAEYSARPLAEYAQLFPSMLKTKEILVTLAKIKVINVEALFQQYHKSFVDTGDKIDLQGLLYQILSEDPVLRHVRWIRILKTDDPPLVLHERAEDQDSALRLGAIRCDNYRFEIE